MLHEFLTQNRDELVKRCREKVAARSAPKPTSTELEHGVPLFLDQLVDTLREELSAPRDANSQLPGVIGTSAEKHGGELLRHGFTIDQVVHDYGDLCQSVTELAAERKAPVTVDEFRTFNRCLDNAIADAVSEFGRRRDQVISERGAKAMNERLGMLAHELRNHLNSALLALEAIKRGNVGVKGATGDVLGRSLHGLRDVIDRSLADVRLTAGLEAHLEPITVAAFLEELQVSAALDANDRGITFTIAPVDRELVVEADRQMLGSAISNLLQNAFKFSRPKGHVSIVARVDGDRVLIEVEDECGGLPDGKLEELFKPFKQVGLDTTGVGLGLSISRRAVEANGGTLRVRNIEGTGCVFTIDLPRAPSS
ncbi:MAG: HAMP domain-containing histidine kinase [Myxococcota bacterium]|nr:HAMP domain-containing histidine kinase [Myxococcota bacterium]